MIPPIIHTRSGQLLDLLHPKGHRFEIQDIAHALSHLCRYTGHTIGFYSVAQHSVLVSNLVPAEDALAALLHDAAEAYIGDVSAPLKGLLPDYRQVETRLEAALLTAFGLSTTLPSSVKHADQVLLVTEMRDLLPPHPSLQHLLPPVAPLPDPLIPWPVRVARRAFLDRYNELAPGHRMVPPAAPAAHGTLGAWLRSLQARWYSLRPVVHADGTVQIGDDVFLQSGDVHSLQPDGTWAPMTRGRAKQKGDMA